MTICPFCGSDKTKIERKTKRVFAGFNKQEEYISASVRCNKCHARGPIVTGKSIDIFEINEKAEQKWNAWINQSCVIAIGGIDSEDD